MRQGRAGLKEHFAFIVEPLESRPDLLLKPMFSCLGLYLGERLVLVLAYKDEPWNGVLVPTERHFHHELKAKFENIEPHSVLGKWLYVSQSHPNFEATAEELVALVLNNDPRIGVVGSPRKKQTPARRKK